MTGNILKTQRWLRVRSRQLAREPLCRECGQPARDVDHITPRSRGGAPFDPANLQSLCATHHSIKTALYDKQGKDWTARGCDENGYPLDKSHPWNAVGAVIHGPERREERAVGLGTHLQNQKTGKKSWD